MKCVHDGKSTHFAAKKWSVPKSSLEANVTGGFRLLNALEEPISVRCIEKVSQAGVKIMSTHIRRSVNEWLKKISRKRHNGKEFEASKSWFTSLQNRSEPRLNHIQKPQEDEINTDDDESKKILSMLDTEYAIWGFYPYDKEKQFKSFNNKIETDRRTKLRKRNAPNDKTPTKRPRLSEPSSVLASFSPVPLILADVQSNYTRHNEIVANDPYSPAPYNQMTSFNPLSPSMYYKFSHSMIPDETPIVRTVLDYLENEIGTDLVLRFYKNGTKKWPADTNKGLFELWHKIKTTADQTEVSDADSDDVKIL